MAIGQLGSLADLGWSWLGSAGQVLQSFCCLLGCGREGKAHLEWPPAHLEGGSPSGDRVTWSLIPQQASHSHVPTEQLESDRPRLGISEMPPLPYSTDESHKAVPVSRGG